MIPANTAAKAFSIEVAADRLAVMLRAPAGAQISAAEVIADVRALDVKGFDDGELIVALERRGTAALEFEIARGVAAVDQRPGKVDYRIPLAQAGGGVSIVRVEPGQIIAKVGPSIRGTAGRDVFGAAIEPKPATFPFIPGRGIVIENGEVVTSTKGSLRLHEGVMSIEPFLEIASDGGAAVTFDGDIHHKGGLRDGRVVRITGSLVVNGAVEAVDATVGGSMQVKAGMIGSGRGRCHVAGDLWCRFIASSNITVLGDIHVQGEVANSRVVCGKKLDVSHGTLYGGRIVANGGITCLAAGNQNSTPTLLEVGTDATFAALSAEVALEADTCRKRARQVREKIEPLLKQLKQLTHQQREKATELLAEASEAEDRADELSAKLATQVNALRKDERLEITVLDVAHAGVTVRIGKYETLLKTALKGPFMLTKAKIGAITSIVLVDDLSGKKTPLLTAVAQTPVAIKLSAKADQTA